MSDKPPRYALRPPSGACVRSQRAPARSFYSHLYRDNQLTGGHVIKLGEGNDEAAHEALAAWPGGLQVGGGITAANARVSAVRPQARSVRGPLRSARGLIAGCGRSGWMLARRTSSSPRTYSGMAS